MCNNGIPLFNRGQSNRLFKSRGAEVISSFVGSCLNGFSNNKHSSKLILVATSCPSASPSPIPPPLSFFPHSPPSFPARGSTVIGWIELLSAECAPSVTILVAGDWNGIKLPNWAIKGYFHPCTSVSVGSSSKYRSGTSDTNETCPPFRWFKSTYVISSLAWTGADHTLACGPDPAVISCHCCFTKSRLCVFSFSSLRSGAQVLARVLEQRVSIWTSSLNPRKTCWVWPTSSSQYPVIPVHNAAREVTNP